MPKHRKDGNGTQKRKYDNHFAKIEKFTKKVRQIKNTKKDRRKLWMKFKQLLMMTVLKNWEV